MPSRRSFLKSSAAAVGGSWAVYATPSLALFELACANRDAGRYQTLTADQAAEVDALTALIVPSDETGPGALEAGAVWYIDAVVSQDPGELTELQDGLTMVSEAVAERYPGQDRIAHLQPAEQLAVAQAIQDSGFFRGLRDATITGMFAHPKHGGNRDKLGWQLLGFDDRHAWQPPFGHYDAPYHEAPDSSS
ncbi:MAG: gluconate 2-dehydrogenase subunit 3 family protein [Rhodothermales bacterium]|nr:gluconate 2-dehydrogenase subunit 3 family protein [Rhodothermales bacterium]MBO6780032.1 gluconate 2-dehydrogenase subunit 3 family protein [Rhodothermales bacterium]